MQMDPRCKRLNELSDLSEINEAATINANSEDVVYKLSALFNAQM